MAETALSWILPPIIEELVKGAWSYIGSQFNWQANIQNNLEKLANILTPIQFVAAKAEHLQSVTEEQKTMLRRLKDAIYEVEDLLDDFEYRKKEAQAEEGGGTVSHGVSSLVNRLFGQDELANRLEETLTKLDGVRGIADTLKEQVVAAIQQQNNMPDRVTSSFPPSKPFGRAEEKEEVINLLLKEVAEPESNHTSVPVIAIVGHGGIGKTTLAQLVYDDQTIKDQFDMRMWVFVPENFNKISLTRQILECIPESSGRNKDDMNFNRLQEELHTKILPKRFLLVLDNVWIQEDNKPDSNVKFFNQQLWETLLAPLKGCKKGSKILVTTRMEIVASVLGASPFTLKGLSDNETWLLLKEYAFGNEIPHNSSKLEEIGQRMIKRLNGSPLATKALASLLKEKPDDGSWLEILERGILDNDDNVRSILRLSYQRLPDHLKYCFAYCSIFPKNWTFEHQKLVRLWIAQGYVLSDGTGRRPPTDIGIDYFKQLLSRSLFDKVEQRYVMHDIIHDLAEDISKDECFRIDGGKKRTISKTVRHLGIVANRVDEPQDIIAQLKSMSNLKNLRTLMFFGYARFDGGDLLFGILKELKSLRVLDFGSSLELQIPKTLCHCLHLRYLNLGERFSGILPKSLSRLYHLQVLSAYKLELSGSMFRLLKFGELKFIDVRRLEFKVERKECHRIGVLKEMGMETAVQGILCIRNLENVTDKAEAAEFDFGSKQYLDGLELHWDSSAARINGHGADQEVAEVLKPHPNLETVTVEGFRGSRCPGWLESKWLDSLQSLSLIDCSELQVLPSLDHLPLLKECKVERCPKMMSFPRFPPTLGEIEISTTGFYLGLSLRPSSSPERFYLSTKGISSHTALLHDQHLWAIQDLTIEDCKEHLPAKWLMRLAALKKLQIWRCQEWLTSEEEDGSGILPPSLESLVIEDCPVTERWLSRCLQGLTSLKELRLRDCPELKSLPQEDGGGVLATSLESLEIIYCPVVTDLSLISHCTSLKKLIIERCSELESLPQANTSLESLEIISCPVTDLSLISHCTSLKKLKIERCSELESLPQADTSLESLEIIYCPVVTDLSLISHCTSLKKLIIQFCDELKSLPQADTSLESLEIWNCPVVTDVSLISHCTSLKKFKIKGSPELKSLPEKGLPTSLEEVELVGCGVPKETVVRCLQGLPSLSTLEVDFWTHLTALPSLRHLRVKWSSLCEPSSKVELPESLQSLQISRCDDVSDTFLCTCLQGLTSLSKLLIWGCNKLTSLPPAQVLQRRTTLKELGIYYCDELTSLGALHALASLTQLQVYNCPKLKSLPKEGLPSSIQFLTLYECHPELEHQIREKKGPNWAKVAHIPNVYID